MPPVAKQVTYIYETAVSGYRLFSYFDTIMGTEKYFSSTDKIPWPSVKLSAK